MGCGFRRPNAVRAARLSPLWSQALQRCGVDPGDVDLYLRYSGEPNAFAAGARSVVVRDSRAEGFIPPKTRSSVRTVPLGRVVVDELAAHLAAYDPADDGSMFTDDAGSVLIYTAWKPLWKAHRDGYKMHDLRHYAASALIAGGASVKQVQTILGHAGAAVTLGVYAHMWPGDDDRARGILDAALADCVRTSAVV